MNYCAFVPSFSKQSPLYSCSCEVMNNIHYENHICELRSEELNEIWSFNFFFSFSLSFRNCKSYVYNYHDHPSFNSSLRSSHIWFSYIHNFIIILSQVYNKPIQRPAPSWLVSLTGRTPHRYRRSQGFESRTSLNNFFQAFFSQL